MNYTFSVFYYSFVDMQKDHLFEKVAPNSILIPYARFCKKYLKKKLKM